MSLVVEDGTGLSTAESYISVTDADTYFTARGVTAWTGSTTVKEQALRKATDYLLQRYRSRWQGVRMLSTQALDWPRANVCVDGYYVASDAVPVPVERACAELALKTLSDDLSPDLDRGGEVASESVGPVAVSYFAGADPRKVFTAIDDMLAPFLTGGRAVAALSRA